MVCRVHAKHHSASTADGEAETTTRVDGRSGSSQWISVARAFSRAVNTHQVYFASVHSFSGGGSIAMLVWTLGMRAETRTASLTIQPGLPKTAYVRSQRCADCSAEPWIE